MSSSKTSTRKSALKKTKLKDDKFDERIVEIREEIVEGLGKSAEETILHVKESHDLTAEQQAKIDSLHSLSFEIRGLNKESLEVLEGFLEAVDREPLELRTQILLLNQLSSAFAGNDELGKAKSLIEAAIEKAEREELVDSYGGLYLTRARINKELGEAEDALDDADNALDHFRESADWQGMASAYYQLGSICLVNGRSNRSLSYFNLAIQMVGENSEPVILGRVFADMASVNWALNQPGKSVEHLEKALEFFVQTDNELQQIFALNDLGMSLMLLGDWLRAEEAIKKSLELAKKHNHPHLAGIYDSYGELKLLKQNFSSSAGFLKKGITLAEENSDDWYLIQNLRTLARTKLAEGKTKDAIEIASDALRKAKAIGAVMIENLLRTTLAEAYFILDESSKADKELTKIEANDPETDFYVLGNIQRIRGLLKLKGEDRKGALNHIRKSVTIFETRGDVYSKADSLFLLGEIYSDNNAKKATDHFIASSEIFRKLGVKKRYTLAEKKITELSKSKKKTKKDENASEDDSVNTQLLMQRLAEATASRELLFRELVAILQQESKAAKMIVAESSEDGGFKALLVQGFTPVESNHLVKEMHSAIVSEDLKRFAKTSNAKVFRLNPPNAPEAALLIFPKYTAKLKNGGKIEPLLRIVELGMDVCALREKDSDDRVDEDKNPFVSQSIMPGFIHSSAAMTKLVEEVYKIRSSDVTVLVTGESGTGKELVSRAIHSVSARKEKVFVPFNCTAVPKELTEGHLFGYKRGAFTGAANDSPGMIKTADGGTLLLDEIGDLPIDVQPKLLRFLQEGEIQPLGEKRPFKVDVRVIAATNMDLEQKVKDGLFREDLFYRINVIRLKVPPLRERRSEIKPMVKYYINHYSARFNKTDITIKPQTIDLLMVSDWEGNVRQLCNEIQRIVARAQDGEVITPDHISPELKKKPVQKTFDESGNVKPLLSNASTPGMFSVGMEGATIEEAVTELETQMIIDAMRRNDGNITRVSKELGLTRRGLYMKIDRYGIKRAS